MPTTNPSELMQQLLQGYQRTALPLYNLNAQYGPAYTNLNLQGRQQSLFGSIDPTTGQIVQPGTLAQDTAANSYARLGNLADVANLGPAGYAALMQANPGLAQSLGMANNYASQNSGPNSVLGIMQAHALDDSTNPVLKVMRDHALDDSRSPLLNTLSRDAQGRLANYQSPLLSQITGNAQSGLSNYRSPLLQSLEGQAQQQIASGGRLSPQETTDLSQGVLSNYAAQGLSTSPQAIAADVLNRDSVQRQRLQAAQQLAGQVQGLDQSALGQAQQFAGQAQGLGQAALGQAEQYGQGVESLGQQQMAGARQFGLGVSNQLQTQDQNQWQRAFGVQGATAQNQGLLGNLAGINANVYDPYQTITGRGSSGLAGFGSGGTNGGGSSAANFNASQIFNPNLNDAFMTATNAGYAQDIANQNRNTALTGAGINAGGAILGGLLSYYSDRRLKKDIRRIGKRSDGLPLVTFRYRGKRGGQKYLGVLAQDVEKVNPQAVVTDRKSGMKMVRATEPPMVALMSK